MANPRGQQRDKPFRDALRKRIMQADGDERRLDKIAQTLCLKAEKGDVRAIQEIADRLDGKVPQQISGDPDNPIEMLHEIRRVIVNPGDTDSGSTPTAA